MEVWNMCKQQWEELKPWMRWCPYYWTRNVDWEGEASLPELRS
jgi:hypothetical protein